MIDTENPIFKLLRKDRRYKLEAYVFLFESLRYAQEELGMGQERVYAEDDPPSRGPAARRATRKQRHLTGQELCEAMRQLALEQFGLMAKCVLNSWGVRSTSVIGEMVFNLISIGEMNKTEDDRREDFNDVFDFDEGLTGQFKIAASE